MSHLDRLNPWVSKPLTDAARKASFRRVMDLHVDQVAVGRQGIVMGWWVGAAGFVMFATSIVGWMCLLPLKTVETDFWIINQQTGVISRPIGIDNAPKAFGVATDEHFLTQYVRARLEWVPEMDRRDDHVAKIMSSPDEQARINAAREKPDSNIRAIGAKGHVEIDNIRCFPQAMDKDSGTRRYLVKLDRTVWHGTSPDKTEPWTAVVDFQWHPSFRMAPPDREDNPGGFVAISFSAKSDLVDQRRQPSE